MKKNSRTSSAKLNKLRSEIDRADKDMIQALAQRFAAVEAIGELKKQLGLSPRQNSRWRKLVDDRLSLAKKMGLSGKFLKKVFSAIHAESLRIQIATKKMPQKKRSRTA